MTANLENFAINRELTLFDSNFVFLTVHALNLSLGKECDNFNECHLNFQVTPENYQRIDSEAFFHLKPELRGPYDGKFQLGEVIEIEAILQPDLCHLLSNFTKPEDVVNYLVSLQSEPQNKLISVESWFALKVKQNFESNVISYRTIWSYLNPLLITQEANFRGVITGVTNFIQDWSNADMSVTQEVISQSLEEMTKAFEELADSGLKETEAAISNMVAEYNNVLEELVESSNQVMVSEEEKYVINPAYKNRTIFEEMINFFTKDDWSFAKIKGEPVLRLVFQGKNGKWDCFARARDESQFIFYSVCPINVSENKRLAVAEFLTRANFGMMIGNYELDFASGEIRYKTSVDASNSSLNFPTIKNLVYSNVMMMDEYLPGIMAVIEAGVEPESAIAQVENGVG
jgi:hypothetical protein